MSGILNGQSASINQRLAVRDALVMLFKLDTAPIRGSEVFYWTPHAKPGGTGAISFGGREYAPVPIDIEGFEWRGRGPAPRPKVRVSNIGGVLTGLIATYGDLVGAEITRTITYARCLDGEPGADSGTYWEPDIWRVERKVRHDGQVVEWELSSILDQEGKRLPGRAMLRDICGRSYRTWNATAGSFEYTGVTCPYIGTGYWNEADQVVEHPSLDRCSTRLTGCKKRFPAGGESVVGLTTWASGQSITSGERRRYGANAYLATTSGTTGATAPTHTSGSVSDGGVTWSYLASITALPTWAFPGLDRYR